MGELLIQQPSLDGSVSRLTKADRSKIAANVVQATDEGLANPLQVLQSIRAWEDIFDKIASHPNFKDMLITEAEKLGKTFTLGGNKMEVAEVGVKYDYSKCNCSRYKAITAEIEALKFELKEIEEMLKGLPKEGKEFVDEDTGEVYTMYPPARKSTTTVKVTLQ